MIRLKSSPKKYKGDNAENTFSINAVESQLHPINAAQTLGAT